VVPRGRPRKAGKVYYLGRLRFRPGQDPPELEALLDEIEAASPGRKAEILRAALIGGMTEGRVEANQVEDSETSELLGGLLEGF